MLLLLLSSNIYYNLDVKFTFGSIELTLSVWDTLNFDFLSHLLALKFTKREKGAGVNGDDTRRSRRPNTNRDHVL